MSSITDLLAAILAAKKGEEVRGSIHDAIELCYQDGKAGASDLQARQLIETVAAVNEQQQAALEVLEARVEELESGEGGSSQQSTTIDIPTVLVDGGVVENVSVNNNSTTTRHITFTTEFTETPKVMVAIGKNVGAVSQYGYLSANILYPTVTTTGFDFFLANRTGSDRSPGVVWYAYQPTVKTIDLDITIPETEGMTEAEVREITGPIAAAVDALKTGYDGTSYQTAAEAVRTQINDLHVLIGDEPGTAINASAISYGEDSNVEDALDGLNERLNTVVVDNGTEETIIYNRGSVVGNGVNANNRWFCSEVIPANTIIHSVAMTIYSSYTSTNTPINIELWALNNDTLTVVKKIETIVPTSSAGQYVEFDCGDVSYNYPVMVSVNQGRTMCTFTSNTGSMQYIANLTDTTLQLSALSSFNGALNIDIIKTELVSYVVGDPAETIIDIGAGYRFTEIQDALDAITDDSASKPYTFVIHPKTEPYRRFSTIRKLSESYPWTNAPVRYISMIGLDKYHCVIEDDSGNYAKPPAEILVNGLIKNLTFVASHSNQDAAARQGAYAVHIDAEPISNAGYDMRFEDCIFKSDQTAGVGIGLHNASHLTFINCEFISTASESYAPYEGYTNLTYLGAFNCHSSTNANDTDQVLTLADCIGVSNEAKAYTIATNANCYMTLQAYNNTFWCIGVGSSAGYKGSYCTIYGANHGNNVSVFNA